MSGRTEHASVGPWWRRTLVNLSMAGIASLVALWTAEMVLGFLASRPYEARVNDIAERLGRPTDRRTRLEVVRALRDSGVAAVPNMWTLAYLQVARSADGMSSGLVPLSGRGNTPTVLCNEGDGWVVFTSDRHGFANPDAAWDQPVEVMLLGDSYALGQCVPMKDAPMERLRAAGHSGLTVGIPSNGPLTEYATFREYVEPLRPQVVLWTFFRNDVDELMAELREPLLRRYLDSATTYSLINRPAARDSVLDIAMDAILSGRVERDRPMPLKTRIRGVLTAYRIRQVITALLRKPASIPAEDAEALGRALADAQMRTRAWGGQLAFVLLPSWESFRGGDPAGEALFSVLRDHSARLGVPLLDATTDIAADDPWAAFALGRDITAHYSVEGNRRLAAALARLVDSLATAKGAMTIDRGPRPR